MITVDGGVGTNIGDGVRVGGLSTAGYDGGAFGAPISPLFWYSIAPVNAAAGALRAAAIINAAGSLPLIAAVGSGITIDTFQGNTVYVFDVPRGISVTGASTGGATVYTISAFDWWWQKVVAQVTLPAGNNTVSCPLALRAVTSISSSAASGAGSTVAINTTNTFGFPYVAKTPSRVLITWNGVPNVSVGTLGNPATYLGTLAVADTTTPATATTGDVRGTYTLASGGANVAPNGTRELVVLQYLEGVDTQIGTALTPGRSNQVAPGGTPLNTKSNLYGVANYTTGWN